MPLAFSVPPGHKHLTRRDANAITASVRDDDVWTRAAMDWGACPICRWHLIRSADNHGPCWLSDDLRKQDEAHMARIEAYLE